MAVFQTGIPSGFQSELLKNTNGIQGLSWRFETVGFWKIYIIKQADGELKK